MSKVFDNPDQLAQACAEHMMKNDSASQSLNIKLIHVAQGMAQASMLVTDTMLNGHKSCHGGIIFSLADSVFAFACNSENFAAVAANCHIDFVNPAFKGDQLIATAKKQYQGKRTGIYQIEVKNQHDQMIALFKGNSARIRRSVLPE